jgi:hypothetical protein
MPVPVFTTGEVLTAANMNAVGLWRVTGCTAGSTGGTAATASNGVITIGTGNTTITVNNAFSADYTNYKIIVSGSAATTNANVAMTLNGGTTAYSGCLVYGLHTGGSPLLATNNNGSAWSFVGYQTIDSGINLVMDVLSPNLAEWTSINSTYISTGGAGTYTGNRQATTQHTGFTLTPDNGNMTGGTIRVYGYRN